MTRFTFEAHIQGKYNKNNKRETDENPLSGLHFICFAFTLSLVWRAKSKLLVLEMLAHQSKWLSLDFTTGASILWPNRLFFPPFFMRYFFFLNSAWATKYFYYRKLLWTIFTRSEKEDERRKKLFMAEIYSRSLYGFSCRISSISI